MVTKILVPVAFSKYSEGILRYSAELAGAFGAEMLIVNVINERDLEAVQKITSFGYKVDTGHYLQTLQEERRREMIDLMNKVGLDAGKVSFSFLVGRPAEELLQLIVEESIDTVVMGVKNRDIRTLLTGSVAEQIFCRCPVTVISYRDADIAALLRKRVLKHTGTAP